MSGIVSARIVSRTNWTPSLMSLKLNYHARDFESGQFFNLSLTIGAEVVRRSYSALSVPNAPLEFFFSRVEGGDFTPALFELSPGDELTLNPTPYGSFTLNEVPQVRTLWMVATGTGLAPYLSMLRGELLWERFEELVLVHGVRHPNELAYQEELSELSASRTKLKYIPLLSGKELGDDVFGTPSPLRGRITSAWESGSLTRHAARPFDKDSHMMLCGNPQMVSEMSELLKKDGFEKHRRRKPGHYSFEKYW